MCLCVLCIEHVNSYKYIFFTDKEVKERERERERERDLLWFRIRKDQMSNVNNHSFSNMLVVVLFCFPF